MTAVLFTTDTELSFMLHKRGLSPLENLRIAVMGEVSDGAWGIGYQMKRLSAHGLKGVFFVEALSSYAFGIDILKRVVDPILAAGHEVQLHLHAEWLKWIDKDIVGNRRFTNIAGFSYDDQRRLLEAAIDAMARADAPRPTAFRAGNYGANNDTLKALATLGIRYDSSYNRPFLEDACAIRTHAPIDRPTPIDGLVEVPVTNFEDYPGHTRGLQLCAVSSSEFKAVIRQAVARQHPSVVAVNHSFELLGLMRTRANRMLLKRFDEYCAFLQDRKPHIASLGFQDLGRDIVQGTAALRPLTSNPVRTAMRMVEQSVGMYFYDRA
jgi:peptidoglycan/xylan/chitin deacetylase (PgdA/CDA1 family)